MPLPAEARNIGVAGYRQWIAYEQYVRFEAPVDVCLNYANQVVKSTRLDPVAEDQLIGRKYPVDRRVFENLSWFDLADAKNVVGGGRPTEARVWVDQNRGVFYFINTD